MSDQYQPGTDPRPDPPQVRPPAQATGQQPGQLPGQQQIQNYNDENNLRTRPCAACGGSLKFSPATQMLVCAHCGSTEAIVNAADAVVRERPLPSVPRGLVARDAGRLSGEMEIVCQNCGGHTTFIGTMTSTRCPYCATPIQRSDVHEAPDRLPVDGVLPFRVTDKAAKDALDQWISKRWFAPTEFKKYSNAGSFESVYSAYFTYDAEATTDYQGERGINRTVTEGEGENQRTRTETDWYSVNGTVYNAFDDIAIHGNTGFEQSRIDALEPWPTHEVQPFNPDYLAGHLSRTYDREVEDCYADARQIMDGEIDRTVRRDIGGDQQRVHDKRTSLANVTYKHLLLPIWLLTVIYAGKPWQVYMNGVTGEIHGERPYSKPKIIAAALVALVVIIVLIVVFGR